MKKSGSKKIEYCPPDQATKYLHSLDAWDFIISDGRHINEPRACWSKEVLPETKLIEISRSDPKKPHRLDIRCYDQIDRTDIEWSMLAQSLTPVIPKGSNVLIDMNLLPFDILLYLIPALRQIELNKLVCTYATPQEYNFPEDALSDYQLHSIEQPKGYAALATDPDRIGSHHLVFLGFDKARAWKFIDRYDWKEEHLYLVLGDPAFVKNGVERAKKAAGEWFEEFNRRLPKHIHTCPAADPEQTAQFCMNHFKESKWLDIVPLSTKPINLGILWFYFSLSDEERGRVRLLYDFPIQHSPRSKGISSIYFYDCSHLLV